MRSLVLGAFLAQRCQRGGHFAMLLLGLLDVLGELDALDDDVELWVRVGVHERTMPRSIVSTSPDAPTARASVEFAIAGSSAG